MKTSTLGTATLMLLASLTAASAQPLHPTPGAHDGGLSFSPEHGGLLRQHAASQHYQSVRDPGFHAQVGAPLPASAQLHPVPDALVGQVPGARQHQYAIVNDRPMIVDPATHRVVHAFE